MKRRDIFRAVLGIPVAATAAVAIPAKQEHATPWMDIPPTKSCILTEIEIPERKIIWSGWKACLDSCYMAAQWIAWPVTKDGKLDNLRYPVYVSCPGGNGAFLQGYNFNVGHYSAHQPLITGMSSEEEKDFAKKWTLEVILDLLAASSWEISPQKYRPLPTGEDFWDKLHPNTRLYIDGERCCQEYLYGKGPAAPYNYRGLLAAFKNGYERP